MKLFLLFFTSLDFLTYILLMVGISYASFRIFFLFNKKSSKPVYPVVANIKLKNTQALSIFSSLPDSSLYTFTGGLIFLGCISTISYIVLKEMSLASKLSRVHPVEDMLLEDLGLNRFPAGTEFLSRLDRLWANNSYMNVFSVHDVRVLEVDDDLNNYFALPPGFNWMELANVSDQAGNCYLINNYGPLTIHFVNRPLLRPGFAERLVFDLHDLRYLYHAPLEDFQTIHLAEAMDLFNLTLTILN